VAVAAAAVAPVEAVRGVVGGVPVRLAAASAVSEEPTVAPPVWLVIPFVVLLLMIATGPLFYIHHWHCHYPKYAVGLGAVVGLYYVLVLEAPMAMFYALEEYLSFIALVAALFVAASGIYVHLNVRGRPLTNVALLSVGAVLANFIATTGAAMLLIRPFLNLNRGRLRPYHVVFFIFIVANVGGALTPIGDPPLFLGFLRGVPFFWTLANVWYVWLPTLALLLGVFYVFDRRNRAVSVAPEAGAPAVRIIGARSLIWVGVTVAAVFVDPQVIPGVPALHVGAVELPFGIRELVMFAVVGLAYRTAKPEALRRNEFNFEPIREVGWLFLGIFACMVPALSLIGLYAREQADALTTGTFFWGTGVLSAFLDNAPTYLNFLAASMGKFGLDVNDALAVRAFAEGGADLGPAGVPTGVFLQAISVAAVFFGAMTYIGNAPNFMVKAIAEGHGEASPDYPDGVPHGEVPHSARPPTFAGYLFRYAIPILLPIYAVIWLVLYSPWGLLS
jgi:Na+/H+ antiporter NhaD/arsenite permease-like protein